MTFTYNSQIIGKNGSQELAICIINSSGNPIEFASHKLTKQQSLDFASAKKGAHLFGIKGWILDPADHYSGYAEKV
jgi:hypothetical protein